jgi:spore coat protein CotH
VLVERFDEVPELEALYEEQLADLRAELYGGDAADEVLASWVETLSEEASELVDEATIAEEADAIAEQFTAS